MDGEVTVRRLFRLRTQNCISPLGHSGGELRMAVSLGKDRMKVQKAKNERPAPVSNLTELACNIG